MIYDTNTWLGNWPFQSFRENTAARLQAHLKSEGTYKALVSNPECIFLDDPDKGNRALITKLKKFPALLPVPILNPLLKQALKCTADYAGQGIKVIKLLPNYHGYSLADSQALQLIETVISARMIISLQVRMEDERAHHPACRVPGLSFEDIIKLAAAYPDAAFLAQSLYYGEALEVLKKTSNVLIDISFTEHLNTVQALLKAGNVERVLFGSHTPFYYTRAAIMKLQAPEINKRDREMIAFKNADKTLSYK